MDLAWIGDGAVGLPHPSWPSGTPGAAQTNLSVGGRAIDTGSGSAARSGSRFELLAIDEGDDQPDAEGVAVQPANMVLPQTDHDVEGGPWSSMSRRKKSKEELVGFPTPASRVWERRGSTSPASSAGCSCLVVRKPPRPCRGATPRSLQCIRPWPWKGPLPRPRVTPPVALAAFLPNSQAGPSSSTVPTRVSWRKRQRSLRPSMIPM